MRAPDQPGIRAAAAAIARILPPTPLIPFEAGGQRLFAKAECLQPVGWFKIRGAWHRLGSLLPQDRARGVVAASSGNHAAGLAWAARRLGIESTIVMPRDAPTIKLAQTRALCARIVLYDRMHEERGGNRRGDRRQPRRHACPRLW